MIVGNWSVSLFFCSNPCLLPHRPIKVALRSKIAKLFWLWLTSNNWHRWSPRSASRPRKKASRLRPSAPSSRPSQTCWPPPPARPSTTSSASGRKRWPAGHRHQRDRVQHHPLLEGNAPAVPFPLWHPAAQRRWPQQRHPVTDGTQHGRRGDFVAHARHRPGHTHPCRRALRRGLHQGPGHRRDELRLQWGRVIIFAYGFGWACGWGIGTRLDDCHFFMSWNTDFLLSTICLFR